MASDNKDPERQYQQNPKKRGVIARRAARYAAVQALYQVEVTDSDVSGVLQEFLLHRLDDEIDGLRIAEMDRELFERLVRGVRGEREDLDNMLAAALAEGWHVERLEALLRVIMRVGIYELDHRRDLPARATISEYLDLAHGFFTEREPALVNGVLDSIARSLRPEEFESADAT
ncbi:MAG: transcription antitermination factor NusB [Rhodovibrionaceae bacterium]